MPLLTVPEVATALHVSRSTVYNLVERGELAAVRVSNSIRVARDELRRFLSARS